MGWLCADQLKFAAPPRVRWLVKPRGPFVFAPGSKFAACRSPNGLPLCGGDDFAECCATALLQEVLGPGRGGTQPLLWTAIV